MCSCEPEAHARDLDRFTRKLVKLTNADVRAWNVARLIEIKVMAFFLRQGSQNTGTHWPRSGKTQKVGLLRN